MLFRRKTKSERLGNLKTMLTLSEMSYKHMKNVNDYYREHGTTLGCPGVAYDAAKIIDSGIEKGEYPDGLPFSDYVVMRNYYEIQRLKRKIAELESQMLD